MTSHALLSPSGAERWLNCTPSARLETRFEDTAGNAAKEGTLAHSLGELMLRLKLKEITLPKFKNELLVIQANPLYESSMYDHIEDYSAFVLERFSEAQSHTSDALLFLEVKLDLTKYIEEGFGTGDSIIIANGVMDITDLKYGKGVPVSAENNKQMMLYALGALEQYDYLYSIHTVRMTIFQPRIENISSWELSVADLNAWAATELIPKAKLAFDGTGSFNPGKHCRFCKARGVCRAYADMNLEIARYDFRDVTLLTDQEIADILQRAEIFTTWITSVKEHALHEAVENHKRWPGLKLVEGKSSRKYSSEELVAQKLISEGIKEETIYEKKLLPITRMEKLISKDLFHNYLSDLILKPPGAPTLVPDSDKRPEISSVESAKLDFANF